jgi:hypothetical protein
MAEMHFNHRHQHRVCILKIIQLTSNSVAPFHTMKQIVPQAKDDDQDGGQNFSVVLVRWPTLPRMIGLR